MPDTAEAALADVLRRAEERLSPRPPGPGGPLSNPLANPRGDHSLDPSGTAPDRPHREAAVLVPLLPGADGVSVLLTLRASHLRDHSGQVAFPGGKIEPGDASPREAALREAREEIGLEPSAVRVLGHLDPYLSATGFLVTPVVGLVAPGAALRPDPAEVAEVFAVPLPFLMEPARYEVRSRLWQGRTRHFYAFPFDGRLIWGVTAGILHNLYERLYG